MNATQSPTGATTPHTARTAGPERCGSCNGVINPMTGECRCND